MTTLLVAMSLLQKFCNFTSGVGSSTLAIVNFFAALADGKIDETERRMMGLVYIVLRVAMVLILLTTMFVYFPQYIASGFHSFSVLSIGTFIALGVLYSNAILMTLKYMPSTFGPAIQAGNWYVLGFLSTLAAHDISNFTLVQFLLAYTTWIILLLSL